MCRSDGRLALRLRPWRGRLLVLLTLRGPARGLAADRLLVLVAGRPAPFLRRLIVYRTRPPRGRSDVLPPAA
ncbi:MAG TPA: hypothetical protein VFW96_22025 [Thermomicrobiales bacterium]|nr:hypothetical protein [Thermomicrobiales bacterium]